MAAQRSGGGNARADATFRRLGIAKIRDWTGALTGREAAMQILLPIAAVSIGMFIFGLVYYFDIPHAGY